MIEPLEEIPLDEIAAVLGKKRKSTIFILELNHNTDTLFTNSAIMLWDSINEEHIEKIANMIRFKLTQAMIIQTELFNDDNQT